MEENQNRVGLDQNPQIPGSVQPATEVPVQQPVTDTSQSPVEPTEPPVEAQPQPTPPSPNPSNKILMVGLAVLFISLLVGGAYYFFQNQKQKTPTSQVSPTPIAQQPTPTPDPTTEWETYSNDKYGYELKITQQWSVSSIGNDDINQASGVLFNSSCNYDVGERCQQLLVGAGEKFYENYKLENYININTNSQWPEKLISKESVTIDSTPAIKYEIYSNEFYGNGPSDWGVVNIEVITIKNGKIYRLTLKETGKDQSTIKTSSNWFDKESFDQILSTFKFLD